MLNSMRAFSKFFRRDSMASPSNVRLVPSVPNPLSVKEST